MAYDRATGQQSFGKMILYGLIAFGISLLFIVLRPFGNACTSLLSSGKDRGIALDLYGDKPAAIAAYTSYLEWHTNDPEALENRGRDYEELGQLDLALADQTKVLQLQPRNWPTMGERAKTYQKLGQWDLALGDLTHATEVQPDIWNLWSDRGDAYLERGDYANAAADYTHAISAGAPDGVDFAYYPRAITYLRSGSFDLAGKDFETYLAKHPGDTDAVTGLACAKSGTNTGDCAIAYPSTNPAASRLIDAAGRSLSGCDDH